VTVAFKRVPCATPISYLLVVVLMVVVVVVMVVMVVVCVCVCVFVCVCVRVSVLASHAELCMVIEGTLLYQWTALTSCAKKMQGRILKVNCSAPSERTTLLLLLL
jgi:hypothetical protein